MPNSPGTSLGSEWLALSLRVTNTTLPGRGLQKRYSFAGLVLNITADRGGAQHSKVCWGTEGDDSAHIHNHTHHKHTQLHTQPSHSHTHKHTHSYTILPQGLRTWLIGVLCYSSNSIVPGQQCTHCRTGRAVRATRGVTLTRIRAPLMAACSLVSSSGISFACDPLQMFFFGHCTSMMANSRGESTGETVGPRSQTKLVL